MTAPAEPCTVCGVRSAAVEVAMRALDRPEQERTRRYCRRCWGLLRRELQRAEDAANRGSWGE